MLWWCFKFCLEHGQGKVLRICYFSCIHPRGEEHVNCDRIILVSILPTILLSAIPFFILSYTFSFLVKLLFEWYITIVIHVLFLVFVQFLFLSDMMLQWMYYPFRVPWQWAVALACLKYLRKRPWMSQEENIQKSLLIGCMSHKVYLWLSRVHPCLALRLELPLIWLQCREPLGFSEGGHAITSQALLLQLLEIKRDISDCYSLLA